MMFEHAMLITITHRGSPRMIKNKLVFYLPTAVGSQPELQIPDLKSELFRGAS
jgi:hypothetical protein